MPHPTTSQDVRNRIATLMSEVASATSLKADPRRVALKRALSEALDPAGDISDLLDKRPTASIQHELNRFKGRTGITFNQACDRTSWQVLAILASEALLEAWYWSQTGKGSTFNVRNHIDAFAQGVTDPSSCVSSRRSKTGTVYGHHHTFTETLRTRQRNDMLRVMGQHAAGAAAAPAPAAAAAPPPTTTNPTHTPADAGTTTTNKETSNMSQMTKVAIFAIAAAMDALEEGAPATRENVLGALLHNDMAVASSVLVTARDVLDPKPAAAVVDVISTVKAIPDARFDEIVAKLEDPHEDRTDWFVALSERYDTHRSVAAASLPATTATPSAGSPALTGEEAAIEAVLSRTFQLKPEQHTVVDGVLTALGSNTIGDMRRHVADEVRTRLMTEQAASELRAEIAKLKAHLASRPVATSGKSANGKLAYRVVMVKLAEPFKGPGGKRSPILEIEFPSLEWTDQDGAVVTHPRCPEVDPFYEFRLEHIVQIASAFLKAKPIWLYGFHGTGKTTAPEQFCARLGWPTNRINLDSNITRTDFVGKVDLEEVNGASVTRWTDGILPASMREPGCLIIDECDAGRPDLLFVLQRVLEGNGLTLTENGGEVVNPHELFRIAATGNSAGNGDETGIYGGVRVMNQAFMDRFGAIMKVSYLSPDAERRLLEARFPTLDAHLRDQMVHFANEMRTAFKQGEIGMTVSPRGLMSMADNMSVYLGTMPLDIATAMALETVFINRSTLDQRQRVIEIAQSAFDVNLDDQSEAA